MWRLLWSKSSLTLDSLWNSYYLALCKILASRRQGPEIPFLMKYQILEPEIVFITDLNTFIANRQLYFVSNVAEIKLNWSCYFSGYGGVIYCWSRSLLLWNIIFSLYFILMMSSKKFFFSKTGISVSPSEAFAYEKR